MSIPSYATISTCTGALWPSGFSDLNPGNSRTDGTFPDIAARRVQAPGGNCPKAETFRLSLVFPWFSQAAVKSTRWFSVPPASVPQELRFQQLREFLRVVLIAREDRLLFRGDPEPFQIFIIATGTWSDGSLARLGE